MASPAQRGEEMNDLDSAPPMDVDCIAKCPRPASLEETTEELVAVGLRTPQGSGL